MNRPPISVGFAAPKRNEQDRRLAQLRIAQQQTAHSSGNAGTKKEGEAVVHDWLHWLRERADARERVQADVPPQPQQGLRLSELPRRDSISQPKPVCAPVSQPASDTQETPRPQPVDYGLTHDDLKLYDNLRTWWWCELPTGQKIQCLGTRPTDKYKKGRRWFGVLIPTNWRVAEHKAGNAFGLAFWLLLFGSLAAASKDARILGFSLLGVGLLCLLRSIVPSMVIKRLRKRASPTLEKYWQALHAYDDNKAAAEKAACEAARDAELRKRSYWAFLDGYEFERATAEVMQKHQFTAMVTPGSGDGGVDIQVTRNGLKGVVQCKAHVACVGPHVVRDLYGVIHHSGVDFGIIVSRGGFTKGAVDFARHKPIFFLDTSKLIAMQEGHDVLASAFSRKDS
jgi:hypothetical protein